jgi:sarcosine oxidase subunit gamma
MAEVTLERTAVLAGRNVEVNGVAIVPAEPATRISLRADVSDVPLLSGALGVELSLKPKTSASRNGRHALWLGPDEWLVIDEGEADLAALCAGVTALHSAVDISHRNVAILVSGPRAADVLNAGCPQDLSLAVFPVCAASRTVLGKVEIVLWRTAEDIFRVEVWRSFSDYAFTLLAEAARDGA